VVCGADTERIRQLGHDRIKTYGAGKGRDKRHWRAIIDNLLAQDLVAQTEREYPVLQLQPGSREVLFEGREVFVLKTVEPVGGRRRRKRAKGGEGTYDEDLFEVLRGLRKQLAAEQGVPPYVVFSDRTLHEMARVFPVSDEDMSTVTGVGAAKLRKYGAAFAEAIREYREQHPDAAPLAVIPRQESLSLGEKGPAATAAKPRQSPREQTWEMLREGASLETIGQQQGKTLNTISRHVEQLLAEGKPVDIDALVSAEVRLLVDELFSRHGDDRLAPVVEAGQGRFDYRQAGLVRAWRAARNAAR
jgi:hypothetical protein